MKKMEQYESLYVYELSDAGNISSFDEAVTVACLQGIINQNTPKLYILSSRNKRPQFWLDKFTGENEWLHGKYLNKTNNLDELIELAGDFLRGAIIWDPKVPATLNVATTVAGIESEIVLSPEFADRYLKHWNLKVIHDLRGAFDGSITGSAKNDAYRWVIQNYLTQGLCSSKLLCLYEDSFSTREKGDIGYIVTRDWAVKNKAFVFDLSPWGDEKPADDSDQCLGLDLQTYKLILGKILNQTEGKHMVELQGFFAFSKYSNTPNHFSIHEPVPTEWETVYLISPYNCYQNTIVSNCYNQSLHSQAPFNPLVQGQPLEKPSLENKVYICFHMADYDSGTPLYDFMPNFWQDANRGKIPLGWGINPNLIETYPDIITYLYRTKSNKDYFTSDASAAGYFNPSRIQQKYWPMVIEHNRHFFDQTDMKIAPMVLDWEEPIDTVKDAFTQFSPDGYGTIIYNFHNDAISPMQMKIQPQVWKQMPIIEMFNGTCNFSTAVESAQQIDSHIRDNYTGQAQFSLIRIVWVSPTKIMDIIKALHDLDPDLNFEVTDPYNFYRLLKESLSEK
jgi:hypothetical protein